MDEIWRDCLPNYQASNLGRIRRSTPGRKTFAGKVMAAKPIKVGYLVVAPTIEGKNKTFYVHDLVARAFLGPRPDGLHVNHLDGNKMNNRVENLEYISRKGNMEHAARSGLMVRGEAHHQAKFSTAGVVQIREQRARGRTFSKLAADHGVSIATAFNAVTGKNWGHIA